MGEKKKQRRRSESATGELDSIVRTAAKQLGLSEKAVRKHMTEEVSRELAKHVVRSYIESISRRKTIRTEPNETILPPVDSGVSAVLQQFADHLLEITHFGTRCFDWGRRGEVTKAGGDYLIPSTFLFRYVLELLGSMSAQVRPAWIDPAETTLRTLVEAFFYLDYLLKEKQEERGYAFLVWDMRKERDWLLCLDPGEELGKQFRAVVSKDKLVGGMSFEPAADYKEKLQDIKNALENTEGYKQAEAEYQRLRTIKKRNWDWYAWHNEKLLNLEALAGELEYTGIYEVIYRQLSRSIHSTNVFRGKLSTDSNRQAMLKQLRMPFRAQEIVSLASTIGCACVSTYLQFYAPSQMVELNRWYKTIEPFADRLGGKPLLVSEQYK